MEENPIFDGRSCSSCTLCCKVLSISELNKPQGVWCEKCDIGVGCSTYPSRPSECQTFYCGYLTWPMVGEHWYPQKCKMVIVSELGGTRVAIHVDPGRPGAWRQEPYYSELKQMAYAAAQEMHQVVVCIGNHAIVILPDRDVDLGRVAEDERIITWEKRGPTGILLEAVKLKADDPRIAGMEPGKLYRPK